MSAEQFSQLSLAETMVTTRAGAAKARTTGSRLQQDSGQDQSLYSIEMPSPSPTPSLVISTNNLQYNVSAFDSDLRRRAKMGLEDKDIKMKYCALSSESDADGIKHFYIDDDITIAIGGKLQNPKCNCGANEKGVACKVEFNSATFCFFSDSCKAHILAYGPNPIYCPRGLRGATYPNITRWFYCQRCELA